MERLGRFFCRLTLRFLPDPLVLAALLTLLVAALAMAFPAAEPLRDLPLAARAAGVADLWMRGFASLDFLSFALQMGLILLTGYGLARAPLAVRALDAIAASVRTNRGGVYLIALVSAAGGWINWGFGLIAAGLLAARVRARLEARGVACEYPLFVAAAYVTMMTWHGGLSGSAPLKASQGVSIASANSAGGGAENVPITIDQTLFAPANLALSAALLIAVPLVLRSMAARSLSPPLPVSPSAVPVSPSAVPPAARSLAAALDRARWLRILVAGCGLAVLAVQIHRRGWSAVNLNFVNLAFFSIGLLLHRDLVSYAAAVAEGGRAVTGIIIQFPLYGGIEAVLSGAGLAAAISSGFIAAAEWSSAAMGLSPGVTLPLATFVSAAVVNVFIPSGGGQWMVQGPIMCSAAHALAVPLDQTVMAVAYGDELTNMIQPFWAVPLMGLTQVEPRRFMGYCALLMLLATPAFVLALLLF